MKVNQKVIIVTGGGNGMGREIVLHLLQKNAKVIAVDVNETTLKETYSLAGPNQHNLHFDILDISKRKAVEEWSQVAIEKWGYVDGIINNAGIIQPFVRINDLDYDALERVMHVNFYGTLYMIKTFLPHLLTRPVAHIVNISSMGGFLPVPGQTIYGASKAAVKLLTEGLYAELLSTQVKVTIVFPGAIHTNIAQNSGIAVPGQTNREAANKSLPPSDAAKMIIDGMENDSFRVLVGKDSSFLDKFYRLNPRAATRFIAEKMKALLG